MATIKVSFPLPIIPEGWSSENGFKALNPLSKPTSRVIEPVGPHFLAHVRRRRHNRSFSEDEFIQTQTNVKTVEDEDTSEISEPEDLLMLQRDAKDWKTQDHYAVLGLSKYRYRATEDQIKRAHRKKVLRHHPDKKAAVGDSEDDAFFKCIQKANDILLDPQKRRQFDSIDEGADVEPPNKKQTQKGNFYKLWSPVFESEARFSKNHPVPQLGDEISSKEDVEKFYNFWYNFDSWRSFEYQDEDVPDDNENREQKRHVERKNQNARKKKKTEDTARLRHLVDEALSLDERIKRFRKEEHAQKNKKRLDKMAEAKRLAEETAKATEEDARLQAEREAAEKAERAEGKKVKEAAKNAAKKNKRLVRGSAKLANYFYGSGDAPASLIDSVLNDVDILIAKLDHISLADLSRKLSGKKDAGEIQTIFASECQRLMSNQKLQDGELKSLRM